MHSFDRELDPETAVAAPDSPCVCGHARGTHRGLDGSTGPCRARKGCSCGAFCLHEGAPPVPARMLSQSVVNLIRDGLPPGDLSGPSVRSAMARACLAGVNAGFDLPDMLGLLIEPPVMSRHGGLFCQFARTVEAAGSKKRAGRTLTTEESFARIRRIYARAAKFASENPLPDEEERRAKAAEVTAMVKRTTNLLAAPEPVKLILQLAVAEAERRGTTRVTLPRRAVAKATGLSEKAVRIHVEGVLETGLAVRVSRGHAAKSKDERLAAIYELVVPAELPRLDQAKVAANVAAARGRSVPAAPATCNPKQHMGPNTEYGPLPDTEYGPLGDTLNMGPSTEETASPEPEPAAPEPEPEPADTEYGPLESSMVHDPICPHCHRPTLLPGQRMCVLCKLRPKFTCPDCGTKPPPGFVRCQSCFIAATRSTRVYGPAPS